MYANDTFFNLTMAGRAGLVVLSLALLALMIWLAAQILRKIDLGNRIATLPARLAVALALFWLFEWLSPQIYYQYYRLIFDGLPQQVVVKLPPPSPDALVELLTFSGKASLSHHMRGLLGWVLLVMALVTTNRKI